MQWSEWHSYYERNRTTALPTVTDDGVPDDPALRASLARTFSIFQLGEAGEGRIAREVWHFHSPAVDDHWRRALTLWVREEGRHGRLLGDCARALGGKPIAINWTNNLLVFGRRLLGIRLKLLVVLSAEVIGITFYGLLARALGRGSIRDALTFIVAEEVQHLAFHSRFFRLETNTAARRLLFWIVWLVVGTAAGFVVLVDHAPAFRKLKIGFLSAAHRFMVLLIKTGRAITRPDGAPLRAAEAKS